MKTTVTLKKGRLSGTLLSALISIYKADSQESAYLLWKWEQWLSDPEIVVYTASIEGQRAGWILFNPIRSTLEELVMDKKHREQGWEELLLDELVARETLLAAVIPVFHPHYKILEVYGFRPTRNLNREGFLLVRMELSAAAFLARASAGLPVKRKNRREKVAVEVVPASQEYEEIKSSLEALLNKLGGLHHFVKPGQSVVIKPNVVSDHGLKDGVYKGGVVTDIRLIRALVELLLPIAGRVIIAEGSSINRSETSNMFRHYGYEHLLDLAPDRVHLVDLNLDQLVEKTIPRGKRMISRQIPLTLEQADVIIDVPVMKIHFAAIVSLCVKSLQGAVPPLEKYMTHFFGLWQNLVNIHHLVKPKLFIIDALTGQEDFGPLTGTPKTMNLLLGGTNPVAVDSVAMRIMGIEPESSPPVLLAHLQGFGPLAPEAITLLGPSLVELRDPFKQPDIKLTGGRDVAVYAGQACPGCRGYLHFGLAKLRKADPQNPNRLLIDRPMEERVNIFLGPDTGEQVDPNAYNIFMGLCQEHHARMGHHLPGCPPHSEVILGELFSLFPDVQRASYAEKSEEAKLGEMLEQILSLKEEG
ncbi:MAG TPA: DUF362 domain-containing protein [Syntrophomonadaceae bacterium]|nr:DUF362 domain-containing protein [Syntrophomonadaceae bacterium]